MAQLEWVKAFLLDNTIYAVAAALAVAVVLLFSFLMHEMRTSKKEWKAEAERQRELASSINELFRKAASRSRQSKPPERNLRPLPTPPPPSKE